MTKTIVKITGLIIAIFLAVSPVFAAVDDFIADENITVTGVTFGATTVDLTILNLSTAESWSISSGVFTVVNPGDGVFKVTCSDSTVKAIAVTSSSNTVACVKNSTPGTSYVTLPSTAGTYTITPTTTNIANSLTYNSACGAATCATDYIVSGSSSTATCVTPTSGGSLGGSTYTPPVTPVTPVAETPTTTPAPVAETPTTTPAPGVAATDSKGNITLEQMVNDATTVVSGDVSKVIAEMGVTRNTATETNYNSTIVAKIVTGSGITAEVRNTITNFVTYGTKATKILGAGERAGVVNSFKAALGKLPTTVADWNDVVKIANGRWPSQKSTAAEEKAETNFKAVYLRNPDRTNSHDDAAITVMAYGLRPANRNLNSEKAAIKSFKAIYGYNPSAATAWDVIRAIAYSGSKR